MAARFYFNTTAFTKLMLLACLLAPASLLAQLPLNDYLQISELPIKAGEKITVKLDPVKSGLTLPNEPVVAVFVVQEDGKDNVWDLAMKPVPGGLLQTEFQVPPQSNAMAVRFVQRNRQANNNGNGFIFPIGDTTAGVNPKVWHALSLFYRGFSLAGITNPNRELSQAYLHKYYDGVGLDNLDFVEKALALYMKNDTVKLRSHFYTIDQHPELRENQILNLGYYARVCGQETVDMLNAVAQKRFPNGRNAWMKATDSLRLKISNAQKLAWIGRFAKTDITNIDHEGYSIDELYRYLHYQAAKEMDTAVMRACELKIENRSATAKSIHDAYLLVAEQAAERGSYSEEIISMALQSMAFYEGRLRALESLEENKNRYGDIGYNKDQYLKAASIYGTLLLQQGKPEAAMYYAGIAAKYFEFSSGPYNDPFFRAAASVASPDSLYNWLLTAFRKEAYNESMKPIFMRTAKAIGKQDAAQTLQKILQPRINALKESLRPKMLDDKAPDFTLAGLTGGNTTLSALKGQVVVLDFWATWCGPCIASFPLMQQLVDANAESRETAIYFVNTWQNEKNKTDVVKDFFAKHPYRFDVLMDAENKVVESFKIKGIPTKIIIDKKGIVRFISVGFYSEKDKSIEELQAMISLAAEAG